MGETQSSGVQQLIDRLRADGVAEGENRAQEIVGEARRRAAEITGGARREAEAVLRQARAEAERTRSTGEEAVRLAIRDAILTLKTEVAEHFAGRVRQLVWRTLSDESFLQKLILEIARRAIPADAGQPREVLLPQDVVGLDDLRRRPEEVREGTLSHFVLALAAEVLREGITFRSTEGRPGIRVQLVEDDVQIDLTDRAVADLLLKHLMPRFRALLEGIVQ